MQPSRRSTNRGGMPWKASPLRWVSALGLALVLLSPWAVAQDGDATAPSASTDFQATQVRLIGYAERRDAERAAHELDAAGIEARLLPHSELHGYAVSAGVFRRSTNARNMERRLRDLGYDNAVQIPPRSPAGSGRPVPVVSPARASTGYLLAETGGRMADATGSTGGGTLEVAAPALDFAGPQDEAYPPFSGSNTHVSGFYQNEAAYAIADPDHWQKFRHRVFLKGDGQFSDDVFWTVSAWGAYDPIFEFTSFYPSEVRKDRGSEAMLRETYLDIGAGDWQFRLGRQHIIWGEMVGLFFADVVSAKDLREFVARDFELIRIPQWAVRAERFAGDLHAELLWIPYVTYDDIGVPGDDFYPFPPPVPGIENRFLSPTQPANTLDNASYGLRMSYLSGGWDLAGFYFRGYDLSPVFARELRMEPAPVAVFRPQHRRMEQVGITAARDLGPAVFKAEVVYNGDRWFNVTRLEEPDGLVQQDFLDYVLGVDTLVAEDTQVNLQFFQRRFFDHDADIVPDRIESGASVYLSGWLPGARLRPEFLLVHSLDRSDWMARPSVTWEPPGDWRLTVGADLFGGPADGLFGRFDHADRVYTELRWDF